MANCPQCGTDLEFEEDELDEGDEFTCEECGANLRVTGVDPIELAPAEDDDEEEDEDEALDEDEEDEDEEDFDEDADEDEDSKRWS